MTQDWKCLLRGGFCGNDMVPFALHPCDRKRAELMVHITRHEKIPLQDILQEAHNHLSTKVKNTDMIDEQIERVKSFYQSIKFSSYKKSAWVIYKDVLLTDDNFWIQQDYIDIHCINQRTSIERENLINIIDNRKSSDRIYDFLNQYYMSSFCDIEDKIYYSTRIQKFPYRARYSLDTIDSRTARYTGIIVCGKSPVIIARAVKNLKVSNNNIVWENY